MNTCPVCGYPELQEPPHAASGGGSYEICPSCGFQFGVDDDDRGVSHEEARKRWVSGGCRWHSKGLHAPAGWSAEAQLERLTGNQGAQKAPQKRHRPQQ